MIAVDTSESVGEVRCVRYQRDARKVELQLLKSQFPFGRLVSLRYGRAALAAAESL